MFRIFLCGKQEKVLPSHIWQMVTAFLTDSSGIHALSCVAVEKLSRAMNGWFVHSKHVRHRIVVLCECLCALDLTRRVSPIFISFHFQPCYSFNITIGNWINWMWYYRIFQQRSTVNSGLMFHSFVCARVSVVSFSLWVRKNELSFDNYCEFHHVFSAV